jgi:uncharacterized membrane protein
MAIDSTVKPAKKARPFRRAVLRGLAVLLPPLLTIVIVVWVARTIESYVLDPAVNVARSLAIRSVEDLKTEEEYRKLDASMQSAYEKTSDQKYVPDAVYEYVKNHPSRDPQMWLPPGPTAKEIYEAYVNLKYFQPWKVIPVFLVGFLLVLYFMGKYLAAGAGRVGWNVLEAGINRLPLIRNVYGSVKQVTDFALNEAQIEFSRVVAVEYPRKGMFSMGLVTGEAMMDIEAAANEPCVSVLMPTSPMPMTGFTCTFRKSETIDLNITIDQACIYIMSCGVVLPSHQLRSMMKQDEIGGQGQFGNGHAELPEPAAASRDKN